MARRAVERALAGRDGTLVEKAVLLTSELVTNAVRHAGLSPNDEISLDIAPRPGIVRITVADEGSGFQIWGGRQSRDLGSGWGLHLVRQLSDRWGVSRDGSTEVWFELDFAS
jgi:anti-sigma regulatory factor (Ser/Thr protein kinase)